MSREITFVRPGLRALEWLAETVQELKGGDPLQPVTVIVPNYYVGRLARRHLAHEGACLNIHVLLVQQLAAQIARIQLGARRELTAVLEASAIRAAVHEAGGPLRAMAHHHSLHEALTRLFRELRRRETQPAPLLAGSPGPVTAAALISYQTFRRLTEEFDDPTETRDSAARLLTSAATVPRELTGLGALILFLPTRVDPADARLLASAARFMPLRAALPLVSDPELLGDDLAREDARLLRMLWDRRRLTSLPRRPSSTSEPTTCE